MKTYFKKNTEWKEIATVQNPNSFVFERTVFVHRWRGTYLVAEAYRGRRITQAITDSYRSSAGIRTEQMEMNDAKLQFVSALSVYVGHAGANPVVAGELFMKDGNDALRVRVGRCGFLGLRVQLRNLIQWVLPVRLSLVAVHYNYSTRRIALGAD